jgi:hypothetical protein
MGYRFHQRFPIRVKSVRYLDVSVEATTEREALLRANDAADQVAAESWDAYQCARLASDVVTRSPVVRTFNHPPSRAMDPDEGTRLSRHLVRVEFCRWCELVVRARTKRRALARALKRSERLPAQDWFAWQVAMPLGEPEEVPDEPPSQR